jgi:hypothetical protein
MNVTGILHIIEGLGTVVVRAIAAISRFRMTETDDLGRKLLVLFQGNGLTVTVTFFPSCCFPTLLKRPTKLSGSTPVVASSLTKISRWILSFFPRSAVDRNLFF